MRKRLHLQHGSAAAERTSRQPGTRGQKAQPPGAELAPQPPVLCTRLWFGVFPTRPRTAGCKLCTSRGEEALLPTVREHMGTDLRAAPDTYRHRVPPPKEKGSGPACLQR